MSQWLHRHRPSGRATANAAWASQRSAAQATCEGYQRGLAERGLGRITTEILPAPTFFYAEDYHQQYLAKNPDGYCGLGGTGVTCIADIETV